MYTCIRLWKIAPLANWIDFLCAVTVAAIDYYEYFKNLIDNQYLCVTEEHLAHNRPPINLNSTKYFQLNLNEFRRTLI